MGKILVSIDGDSVRTDYNKGKGAYVQVINNIERARDEGYRGEIVARMTISPDSNASDIYEQVMHLVNLQTFDSIHWQIDAGFYKHDYNKEKFEKFVQEYNKGISKLINWWVSEMKTGRVYRLYPFLAIVDSILKTESSLLRCGAGHSGYAITTNGKIVACPIMNCIEDFEAGTINDNPKSLIKFDVPQCSKCEYLNLCGGRCLYWRSAKLWPKEGDDLICITVKHYIDEIKARMPEINELIENKIIYKSNFEYEKYFGPEIIP
jgi:putative peptide-modifying radical SAM enzyme